MKFLSRLAESGSGEAKAGVSYASVARIESKEVPGVVFSINRISFGRRMELSRQVRALSQRSEFLEAGSQWGEKIEAGILAQEIDVLYLRWALVGIEGLVIDDEAATVEQLIEKGPEALTREIVLAIKEQCGLTEAERKN